MCSRQQKDTIMMIKQTDKIINVSFGNSSMCLVFDVYSFMNSGNNTRGAIQKVRTKTVVYDIPRGLKSLGNMLRQTTIKVID